MHLIQTLKSTPSVCKAALLRRVAPLLGAALFQLLFYAPYSHSAPNLLHSLIEESRNLNLSDTASWQKLLHYEDPWFSSQQRSLIDDERFFTSTKGKDSPQLELEATLTALMKAPEVEEGKDDPRCRFIARRHYLNRELASVGKLPAIKCSEYNAWITGLKPTGLSLVYAAQYLNNPGSSFGHTLLRIDSAHNGEKVPLLSYAANYAAATLEDPGLEYAVRGIFGGYNGFFDISPYYVHINTYSEIENRDIWEYKLNFSKEEISFLLMHLWELKGLASDYYFFDENCSYQLLGLLEAARPSLELQRQVPIWAIPTDTVRAISETPGLVVDTSFRPARGTVLIERAAAATSEEQSTAKALAKGLFTKFEEIPSKESKSEVLDLAHGLLEYEESGAGPSEERNALMHEILVARSKLPTISVNPPSTPAVRPDQGHRTRAIAAGIGFDDSELLYDLTIRPVYHELLDPQPGFLPGAQVQIMSAQLRHRETESLEINKLHLVDVVSLTPISPFFTPISWRGNFGFERKRFRDGDRKLTFGAEGAAGISLAPTNSLLLFGLVEGHADTDDDYRKKYSLGVGPSLGLILDESEEFRTMISGKHLSFIAGDTHTEQSAKIEQGIALNTNLSLRISFERKREFSRYRSIGLSSIYYYF